VLREFDSPPSNDATEVTFVVHEGETASTIATRLEKERLIRNATIFRWVARWKETDQDLDAGEYRLRRNMPMSEIMAILQQPGPGNRRLTMLEGWRAAELADELDFRHVASRDEFLALVASNNWSQSFLQGRPAGATLEGYLFPDTYELPESIGGRDLIADMLDNFRRRVVPVWENRPANTTLSLYEVVTLASIVEREAQAADERPLIADVFLNRLRLGMPLQADPTVQFAVPGLPLPAPDGYWKKSLSQADLADPSPYNTYQHTGLPPGPICSPGLPAIEAVLHPAATDYLYFVAKGDGTHAFAKTLEEHNQNVSRYR